MAHYLAEKITLAEQTDGKEKERAEKECFDVILKLWQHRHSLPSNRRPFLNFEPLFDLLSKLDPEKESPFFFEEMDNQLLSDLEKDNSEYKSVEEWTNIAKEIDKTARVWIEYALRQAADKAKNDKTKEWIKNAVNLPNSADAVIINFLLDNNPSFNRDDYDEDDFSKKYDVEKLKERISQLQNYSKFNKALIEAYQSELKKAME
jgi:hypothetical protein